jgi:hypothetical protein
MAQRKPPARPAKKAAPAANAQQARKPTAGTGPAVKRAGATGTRPPVRKPGKSIVNQKQTPWGLIITVVVIVALAGGIIGYAVISHKSGPSTPTAGSTKTVVSRGGQPVDAKDPWRMPEVAAAKSIRGLVFHVEGQHTHVTEHVKYDTSPPTGGDHAYYWADCSGTVYPHAIANENAVHMLEHGAVWITYRPGLAGSQVATLSRLVKGQNYTAMSPYPGLKTPISLQAWGYQLFVHKASDPRIEQFIAALRDNKNVAPEYPGNCSQPTFVQHPSTFGHPLFQPVSGTEASMTP